MSDALSSIFSSSVHRPGASLNTTIKGLKRTARAQSSPADKRDLFKVAKVLTKAAGGEGEVTRGQARKTAKKLAELGYLKYKYASDVGLAARHIHGAASGAGTAGSVKGEESVSKKEAAKQEVEQKKKMEARARSERREAAEEKKGIKRSIGLEQWQESETSVARAVRQRDKERQNEEAVDVMID